MGTAVSCMSIENYQVLVRTGAHAWVADEPKALEGDGLGPNPFDLLLASLGTCTVVTVVHYAGQAKIPLVRLWAELEGQEEKESEKKYRIAIRLRARGELEQADLERLKRAAGRCHVHTLLAPGVDIQIDIEKV